MAEPEIVFAPLARCPIHNIDFATIQGCPECQKEQEDLKYIYWESGGDEYMLIWARRDEVERGYNINHFVLTTREILSEVLEGKI